ncbi:MAG: NAD(P)H-hydrate dehydratase [Deltaproteobacteria bacterium]|nr:NAD(P)H-hydrate dehydratase [Deltaproteobacteria bacterium]
MTERVWSLASAEVMRALDHHTIDELGIPGEILMESAGRAVADAVLKELPRGGSVVVVCGTGNNGGDGFVAARHLQLLGVPVRAVLLGEQRAVKGDAARHLKWALESGVPIESGRWRAPGVGVIVDAIFGTGLARAVADPAAAAIRRINAARDGHPADLRVVAVDLPSGSCADTGQTLGAAVRADTTVTFGLPKAGLALEPGRTLAGRVVVARIGIADRAPGVECQTELWTRAAAGGQLPDRPADGHKGGFGHALIVAGSEGKTGAAALAAEGAVRMGAGLVTIACPSGLNDILEIKCTEAMTVGVPDTAERSLAGEAEEAVLALAAVRDAVGLGPGLGASAETASMVASLAKRLEKPLALDADGLRAYAGQPELLRSRPAPTVLTPHPGEAGRLLSISAADVNRDRVGCARRLATASGCVVLLKGAATVAASPEGWAVINPTGGPALGSGGTGDVLLGMLTGLLAQGVEEFRAAALAAFVHGLAADRIAARGGDSGLMASELAREVPAASLALREAARSAASGASRETGLALAFPEP